MSTLSTNVTATVTVGSAECPSPFTITNTGSVAPSSYEATGVVSNYSSNGVYTFGRISGGPASEFEAAGGGSGARPGVQNHP